MVLDGFSLDGQVDVGRAKTIRDVTRSILVHEQTQIALSIPVLHGHVGVLNGKWTLRLVGQRHGIVIIRVAPKNVFSCSLVKLYVRPVMDPRRGILQNFSVRSPGDQIGGTVAVTIQVVYMEK